MTGLASSAEAEAAVQVPLWRQAIEEQDKKAFNAQPIRKMDLMYCNNDEETKPANIKGDLNEIEMELWAKVAMTLRHNHNRFPWQTWTCINKGCFDLLDDAFKEGTDAEVQAHFQSMVIMMRQLPWLTLRINPAPGSTYQQGDHYQFFIDGTHPEFPVDKTDRSIMTNAWSVRSLLHYAADLKRGGKPGFDCWISLLRAIHYFPNRQIVPQSVGNVAIELAQFTDHFELDPHGPYEATSDSEVLVRIRKTPEILAYLKELHLCIEQRPASSWARAPDASVPYASGAAPQSAVPLPEAGPSPAPGLAAVASSTAQAAGGGDVPMTDAAASVDAASAEGKGKGKSQSGPAAANSAGGASTEGSYSHWGYGKSNQWQDWGSSTPSTGNWTQSQQDSGSWRRNQYGGKSSPSK